MRPTGHLGRSLLIVGGKHARLSNISAAGRWIVDEVFWVAGERKHHKAGDHVGRTLEEWRLIRGNPKTAHLLQRVEVMAQPAAVTDSVIFTWVAESQAEEFGACLWTRDTCGGAGGGEACRTAMFCAGQIPNYIAAKMTAVLQPTDTDFAFPLRRFAEESKLMQRLELMAALAQLKLDPVDLPRHYGWQDMKMKNCK